MITFPLKTSLVLAFYAKDPIHVSADLPILTKMGVRRLNGSRPRHAFYRPCLLTAVRPSATGGKYLLSVASATAAAAAVVVARATVVTAEKEQCEDDEPEELAILEDLT